MRAYVDLVSSTKNVNPLVPSYIKYKKWHFKIIFALIDHHLQATDSYFVDYMELFSNNIINPIIIRKSIRDINIDQYWFNTYLNSEWYRVRDNFC
jgi:hypothetical protein